MKTTVFCGKRCLMLAALAFGCGDSHSTAVMQGPEAGAPQADGGGTPNDAGSTPSDAGGIVTEAFVCKVEAKLPGWGRVSFELQGNTLTPNWGHVFDDGDLLLPSMVDGDILVVGRANQKVNFLVTEADPRPYHCAGAPTPGTSDCSGMREGGSVYVGFTGDFIGSQGFPKLTATTFEFYSMSTSVPDTTKVSEANLPILMEGATKIADVPGFEIAPFLCSNP